MTTTGAGADDPGNDPEAHPSSGVTPPQFVKYMVDRMARRSEAAGSNIKGKRHDKFTERAKRVLTFAQKEAQHFNHNYIGTEHLLLGLLREKEGVGAKVIESLGVSLEQVREGVNSIIGRGDRMVIGDISLTPRAKKVVELAVEEARALNHNYIGTEHLLLGLVREGEGIAAGILISRGIGMTRVRRAVLQVVGPGASTTEEIVPPAGSPRDNVITCRIDSADLEALDALVEAGIRSTRSDAASWLIHAGIEANFELFDKVYATVTEIRRLREMAQGMAKEIEAKAKPAQPEAEEDSGNTPKDE